MFKKSQITLFLLVGMVMLVVFGFLFYSVQTVTKTRMESSSEKIIVDLLETTALKYYVTTCLEESAKKGLKLIGDQGGFLHKNQRSIINWSIPSIEYEYDGRISYVSYQLYSATSNRIKEKSSLIAPPPFYPCFLSGNPDWVGQTCYLNYDHTQKWYIPSFGTIGEPENEINPDLCKEDVLIADYSCDCSNAQNCRYSIQAQLEAFIENETARCVDFSSFEEYNITMGKVKANVSFGLDDVDVKIDFPITIRIKGYQPVIRILDFYTRQPVRLKKVFDVARDIITEDINDIEFKIEEDSTQFTNIYPGISVESVDFLPNTSIVKITDSNSKIDGKSYVFMFARENRAPALDYFKGVSPPPDYDVYVMEGETLFLSPIAYDSDEDSLIYDYTGWKSIELESSSTYLIGDNCENPVTGENDTKRCASYTTTDSDNGNHFVEIWVRDNNNDYDKQNVSILVDDKPNVVAEPNNFYDDIANDYASIEDLFFIDLSSSTNVEGGELYYRWDDSVESSCDMNSFSDVGNISFPSENPDITNMDGCFDTTGEHIITIYAQDQDYVGSIGSGEITTQVKDCLPHRNDAMPYPFNEYQYDLYPDETDPFQANHTCCVNYQIQTGNECYYLEDYGCIDDFESGSIYYDDLNDIGLAPTSIQYNSPRDDQKDVYKRVIRVRCDGTSGNMCKVSNSPNNYDYIITNTATKCGKNKECVHSPVGEAQACK